MQQCKYTYIQHQFHPYPQIVKQHADSQWMDRKPRRAVMERGSELYNMLLQPSIALTLASGIGGRLAKTHEDPTAPISVHLAFADLSQ